MVVQNKCPPPIIVFLNLFLPFLNVFLLYCTWNFHGLTFVCKSVDIYFVVEWCVSACVCVCVCVWVGGGRINCYSTYLVSYIMCDSVQERSVGGVEGDRKHQVLPDQDSQLVRQVVEVLRLVHL